MQNSTITNLLKKQETTIDKDKVAGCMNVLDNVFGYVT